jgi:hypothetical protein
MMQQLYADPTSFESKTIVNRLLIFFENEHNKQQVFFQVWKNGVESQIIGESFPLSAGGNWINLHATNESLLTIAVDQRRYGVNEFMG